MQIFTTDSLPITNGRLVVLDVDNTVWDQTVTAPVEESNEWELLSKHLKVNIAELKTRVSQKKSALRDVLGRDVSMYEILLTAFQVPIATLVELRDKAYSQRQLPSYDPIVCWAIERIANRVLVAYGSNSPWSASEAVLTSLGLRSVAPEARGALWTFGHQKFGYYKPNPKFFCEIADRCGVPPNDCISVGDKERHDCQAAIAAGFRGAILVSGPDELPVVAEYLCS